MMKSDAILAEVCERLALMTAKFGTATVEEMPALIDEAKDAVRVIFRCCLASDPVVSPQEAAMLRAELVRLGEALEAQIGEITDVRLVQRRRRGDAALRRGVGD
jgi:hypothetical protein